MSEVCSVLAIRTISWAQDLSLYCNCLPFGSGFSLWVLLIFNDLKLKGDPIMKSVNQNLETSDQLMVVFSRCPHLSVVAKVAVLKKLLFSPFKKST